MFKNIGTIEWILIAFIIALLLGSKKIPGFFKAISDALLEFKKAAKGDKQDQEKKPES